MSRCVARNPPRLSWVWRCPISLHYRTRFESLPKPHAKRRKTRPCDPLRPPKRRSGIALATPPRRRKTPRDVRGQPPPPRSPDLARACGLPHSRPLDHQTRRGGLPPFRGTAPRRRQATRRGSPRRGRPPLPRPSSSAPPRRRPRRSWVPSPRRALQGRPERRATRKTSEDRARSLAVGS